MNCRSVIRLMHDYLDDDIDENSHRQLINHLKVCNECKDHFNELKITNNLLKQLSHTKPAPDYVHKVITKLPKREKRYDLKKWFRRNPSLVAASIFLVLFAFSLASYNFSGNDLRIVSDDYNNLVIDGNEVIVPEGKKIAGDLYIENGNLDIKGEVVGDVTVINGKILMANASNVDGSTKQVDQFFEWIWYQLEKLW